MSAKPTSGAQTVRRALGILRILARGQERGVRLTDVVAESGLNRPTVHRLLRVLVEEGAVEQDPHTRKYMVGQEMSLLGLARSARFPIRAVADPYLRHLADGIGDTVFLTIRNGFDSICIDRKTGDYPIKVLSLEVGARRPLGVGVSGVAMLALLPPDEAIAIARANEQRLAAHGLTSGKLIERVRAARSRGYAFSETGLVKGTRAVAVAVRDAAAPVAAISVAALASRLSNARVAGVVAAMLEQQKRIEQRLAQLARARSRLRVPAEG